MKSTFVIVAALFVSVAQAFAQIPGQRPSPRLGYVYPAGGQQGTTFTVSVGGQTLLGATAAYFSGNGVQARIVSYDRPLTQKEINDLREKLQQLQDKRAATRNSSNAPAFTAEDEKALEETRAALASRGNRTANPALAETVTLEVTVAADATPGDRELRLKTPAGLSNPIVFRVGQLPETTTAVVTPTSQLPPRPNRLTESQKPDAAISRVAQTITLPTLVNGQIMPGEVDRFRFSARKGQHLTIVVAARALLPYLADAVPGWFQATLAVHDSKGREVAYADDFRFHPDPVVLCEIPADGDYTLEIKDAIHRGREDFVYRIAIGELPFVTAIFPLGGRAGDELNVSASGWNLVRNELAIATLGQGQGVFDFVLRDGGVLSNPVRFGLDAHASLRESEPNDSRSEPQTITLPRTLDGRIDRAGDADVFRFEANAGTRIVAEVLARRLNSPLDSVVELFDATGKRLATNDDFEDKSVGHLTHHADSRIEATLPANGLYFVRISDTQRRGGAEFGYRLRISTPEPDFALRIVPSTINIRAGSTATLTAYAVRRDGFDGEISLGLKDPPRGFQLSGSRIPAGQESAKFTLTAAAASSPSGEPQTLTFIGTASINGERVTRIAAAAEDMMQAFANHHLVPSQEFKVCVLGRGPSQRPFAKASPAR